MRILDEDAVRARARMPEIVEEIERALVAHAEGRLVAPPRLVVPIADRGDLVFTVGGELDSSAAGFRVYDRFAGDSPERSQLTVVLDSSTGALRGVVVGELLGQLRTGAIGGVAIRHLASERATTLGLVGTGRQARTQLEAAVAVRPIERVRVHGRDAGRRELFARDTAARLDVTVEAVGSAREAVAGADIVVTATSSPRPVLETAWLAPSAHVNLVGPKLRGRHEWPVDLAAGAELVVTDAPDQLRDHGDAFLLHGEPAMDRLVELSAVVSGAHPARRHAGRSVFISTGLAGTEVVVADHLLRGADTG